MQRADRKDQSEPPRFPDAHKGYQVDVQIKRDETNEYPVQGNTMRSVTVDAGGLGIIVILCSGKQTYCAVVVQNASHRAWRGMGKQYPSLAEAQSHYKDKRVSAGLIAVGALVAQKPGV